VHCELCAFCTCTVHSNLFCAVARTCKHLGIRPHDSCPLPLLALTFCYTCSLAFQWAGRSDSFALEDWKIPIRGILLHLNKEVFVGRYSMPAKICIHVLALTSCVLPGCIASQDYIVNKENWVALKPQMPFGQVPVLEVLWGENVWGENEGYALVFVCSSIILNPDA